MSTLIAIEEAAQNLPKEDQQRLMLWLARSLRAQSGQLPAPRQFSDKVIREWIAEDEDDLKAFLGRA